MCERRSNEPVLFYLLRYVAEQPRSILAVIGWVAASVMYVDMRSLWREQVEASQEVASQLSELNVRINDLEQWRKTETSR